jgi:hypothetical protein
MKRLLLWAMVFGLCGLLAGGASAEWIPGDAYKMHWPQLPDPYGWDINVAAPNVVADDWLCTESGAIRAIHLWCSVEQDGGLDPYAVMDSVELCLVSIFADVPDPDGQGPGYSMPGELLWTCYPEEVSFAGPFPGYEGWASPAEGIWRMSDHRLYFQVSFTSISEPFFQQEDQIYWLGMTLQMNEGYDGPSIGWKTTFKMKNKPGGWNDDAVYWVDDGGAGHWEELWDPSAANRWTWPL